MPGFSEIINVKILMKITFQFQLAFLRPRLTAANDFNFCIVLSMKSGKTVYSAVWSVDPSSFPGMGEKSSFHNKFFNSAESLGEYCSNNKVLKINILMFNFLTSILGTIL